MLTRISRTAFLLLLVSAPSVVAQPVGTFPRWEERTLHQLTNRARVAPATDLAACGANCSAAELLPACYTAIAPLAWNLDLNEAARFHSAHMAKSSYFDHNSNCKVFPSIDALYPESCDASFACSCETSTPVTTPGGRVGLFGTTYSGEIIAAGQVTPHQAFYAWLHEAAPAATCGFSSANGHRWLILKNSGPAVGYGYQFEAPAPYDHYWTGDFGGSGTVVPKIPSGSHWGVTTQRRQEANVEFWANWNDTAAPTEPTVIVDGVSYPLVLSRGTVTNGAWTATLSGLASGCHAYYFSFRDSASVVHTYPATGSFGLGDGSCADWSSSRTTSTPPPGTPTGLVANASSSSSVAVSWTGSASAAQYQLERSSNNGPFTLIATIPGTTYTNTAVSAGVTYLYRVRALNASNLASGYSNVDHGTTIIFMDDPLVAQSTVIKSVHLTELRTAVDAMRAAVGLAPASFTDSGAAGVIVKAVHITELRTALDAARSMLGLSTGGYTDSSLTAGMTVRAVHFQDLRNRTK